ncbi:MAG: acyl-CoA desaturase [Lewinella sp.]
MHHSTHPDFPALRYGQPDTAFLRVLKQRVEGYFTVTGKDRFADRRMIGKTIFLLGIFSICGILIYSDRLQGIGLIATQVLWYVTMFIMTVGIAHDASHRAYSPHGWVNRELNRVFDFVGINTYMWEYNHVKSHHRAPNVPEYDSAIDSFQLFRFHPRAPWRPFHRYQAYYIVFVYALATLFKLFFLDFFSFRRDRIGFLRIDRHPRRELVYFFFTRSLVIAYTLVGPLWLLSAPDAVVWTGFLLGHAINGLALGAIFQVTHLSDRTSWPEPDPHGQLPMSYDRHILLTTADFCPDSAVVTWISGGLNLHVIHHYFPGISQVHLRPLTRILRQTAREFGMPYVSMPSVYVAIRSHLRCLHLLGQSPTPGYSGRTFESKATRAVRKEENFERVV